jgi:hypothetical protein
VQEDTVYPTAADVKSVYPYTIAGGTFGSLWDPGSITFHNQEARLVRIMITNPASQPVALGASVAQDPSGSWKSEETWGRDQRRWPCETCTLESYVLDGRTLWGWIGLPSGGPPSCVPSYPTPITSQTSVPAHTVGNTTSDYDTCIPRDRYPVDTTETISETGIFSTSDVAARVFAGPIGGGGEVTPPALVENKYVVPAATGATPGTLVLYLTRPLAADRTYGLTLGNMFGAGMRYETHEYDYGIPVPDFEGWLCVWSNCTASYYAHRGMRFLAAAEDHLAGSLTLTTRGTFTDGTSSTKLVGADQDIETMTFADRILTTH